MTPRSLFLALLLFALPVFAQPLDHEIAISYGRTETEQAGDAPAIGASYARFWTDGIATRIGGHTAGEDYPDDQGDKAVGAYFAVAEYHFFRGRTLSPYGGAGLAYGFARTHLSHANFRKSDSVLTAMLTAGLDVNVTRRLAIAGDIRYMKFDPDLGDRHGSTLDPTTVMASAKYRF